MTDRYLNSLLGNHEQILLVARQHWLVLLQSMLVEIAFIVLILLGSAFGMALFALAWFGFFLLLLPFIGIIKDILIWSSQKFIVTNLRVIQVSGIFNKNVTDSSLEKVNDVKMIQSFLGRLFDYGDIEILTASELGVNKFSKIGRPIRFKTSMLNSKGRLENVIPQAVPVRTSGESISDVLLQLNVLKDKGILSEEEFASKKKMLLEKLGTK